MTTIPVPIPPKPQRLRLGGPLRVLVVVEPASLMMRMTDVVRSMEGLQLAGAFSTGTDAVEWALWDRDGWHLAFVDLGLRQGSSQELVQRLLSHPRPGTIAAIGDHLWKEIRESCAKMGVHHLLEKGDLIAFRSFLEQRTQ
jgi:DNA-binding NarL/FixJ family response regulator